MSLSIIDRLKRVRLRLASSEKRIADRKAKKRVIDTELAEIVAEQQSDLALCQELENLLARAKEEGMLRVTTARAGLSLFRPTRIKQVLAQICRDNDVIPPSWITEIRERDVRGSSIGDLVDRYVYLENGLSDVVPAIDSGDLANLVRSMMSMAQSKDNSEAEENSEKSEDIWAVDLDWNYKRAKEIAVQARRDFGGVGESAIHVGERNAVVLSSWCHSSQDGVWINDVADEIISRLHTRTLVAEVSDAKAGAKIKAVIDRGGSRSLSAIENDVRLIEAVAVFSTPGAVAQGVAHGLFDVGRKFANEWFGDNRNMIARHYSQIGSTQAFRDIIADREKFQAVHAPDAAPKNAQSSRFWGREVSERDSFEKITANELIEQARHDLVDTSLRSALVDMPANKSKYIDLGSWQKNEAAHAEVFDVGKIISKAFLYEARESAEIQVMQGTNPIAVTLGLVTWISADEVEREAPLFMAVASFDPEARKISRLSDFNLNSAWLRRLAVEYPKMGPLEIAPLFSLGSDTADCFAKILSAINGATGAKPIVEITDQSYVGVFDSSRSVLGRRLNVKAFPELVDNPIVRMLAQGTDHQIVYEQYQPQEGRSRPDEVQTLAVKGSLGGRSFLLEGPPGTGKTQTIFEMVLALSAAGKRVLVTAAMPGAIEVIGRRLRGAVAFALCSMRAGQIDIGAPSSKVNLQDTKYQVVIGTPLALTSQLRADDEFDVLIVDESSQMRLSHALAVAGHASQMIVAGDSRQLQPRDSESDGVAEMSLLMRARMAGMPAITLRAHYRSQHPSLIAWSNLYSYESKLKPRTGPLLYGDAGFSVVYVAPGRRVERNLVQVNPEEADRIAEKCLRWARDGRRTVGVAAMSQAQRDLIRETVEQRMAKAGISAATAGEGNKFFSKVEPFFVRTAGAVQGEERDIMLVSLAVAPNSKGKINQNVGLLSRPDALALCNVVLSRARIRTAVYCSIVMSDINVASMTPAMFLIASILRMGAVVSALESAPDDHAVIDPKTVNPRIEWTIDRLQSNGEIFYAVRIPVDTERYAFAIVSRRSGELTPLTERLLSAGWKVFGCPPQNFVKPSEIIIRALDQLPALPRLAS